MRSDFVLKAGMKQPIPSRSKISALIFIMNHLTGKNRDPYLQNGAEYKKHLLVRKTAFTVLILAVYILGRRIPLPGIDITAYTDANIGLENTLLSAAGGDLAQYSIFALSVTPYIWGSMTMQILGAFWNSDKRVRFSHKRLMRIMNLAALAFAVALAISRANKLQLAETGMPDFQVRCIDCFLLVMGAELVIFMCSQNRKYGIGGQTMIILVNMIENLKRILTSNTADALLLPLITGMAAVIIELFMENRELHIPVLRISIHNIYAKDNYLAIKYNPIGIMPVIFASIVFLVPQMLLEALLYFQPDYQLWLTLKERMVLTDPLGMAVYLVIIYLLTFIFTFIFLRPDELTEQFMKSGDCLENVRAGRETQRYIMVRLTALCILSATIMSAIIGGSSQLISASQGDAQLMSLPSTLMLLTSLLCTLSREWRAERTLDRYHGIL